VPSAAARRRSASRRRFSRTPPGAGRPAPSFPTTGAPS
jgi:hypothetical protein